MLQFISSSFKLLIGCIAIITALASCMGNMVFDSNQSLPPEGWPQGSKVAFDVEITDTINLHNMYVNVRNSTSYPNSNLFLFLDIHFPDGQSVRDTLECILADFTGKWTGRGGGRIRSNKFLFRTDVWFPQKGNYNFSFEHAMRTSLLEGITDIGLAIERK